MKKTLVVMFVVLLALPLLAASKKVQLDTWAVSLNGVNTTGAGDDYRLYEPSRYSTFYTWTAISWQTSFTGTPTAITVQLQGSNDGSTWEVVDTSTSTAGESRSVVNKFYDYMRCNISAYTVNSSTATCQIKAVPASSVAGSSLPDAGADGACLVSTSGEWVRGECSGTASTGTVTHTGGALTSGAVLVGNGADDVKGSLCDVDAAGKMTCPSFASSGTGPDNYTAIADPESCSDGDDWYSSTTAFTRKFCANGTAKSYAWADHTHAGMTTTVASGTVALGTDSIAANACATAVALDDADILTTDTITWTPNADISGVTGYTPAGTLRIYPYPTAGHANFKVCNGSATDAVVPGAVTLNVRVSR